MMTAHDLLVFDREYQSVLFKYIGFIESQMRAQYSHWMRYEHGDCALYNSDLFLRKLNHTRTIEILNQEIARAARKAGSSKAAQEQSRQNIPIDTAIECATLGTVSRLFSNTSDRKVTDKVACSFGCSKSELSSWLRTITDVRNICAHFSPYVTKRQIPSVPLRIKCMPRSDNTATFYIVLLILHLISFNSSFLPPSLNRALSMKRELEELFEKFLLQHGDLSRAVGIPPDWRVQIELALRD